MATPRRRQGRKRLAYDTDRLMQDMARKGWELKDLASAAGVSHMTISRFLRDECQTVKTAKRISLAMGRAPGYYLVSSRVSGGQAVA